MKKLENNTIISFVGLYIVSIFIAGVIFLTSPESALPVQVTLVANSLESIKEVSVSRLSANGTIKPLVSTTKSRTRVTFSDVAQHVYYKGIRISFTNRQLASIQAVDVSVGQSTTRYEKDEVLKKWSHRTDRDSIKTFDYTAETANKRILGKKLPILNADISYHNLWIILLNRLPFLALLLFIGYVLAGKLPADYISSWMPKPLMLAVLFTLALLVYKLPFIIQPVGYGLDPSWITALNWAQYKNMKWGEDLAFTYGPYFWLLYPGLVASHISLVTSFVTTVIIYGCVIGVFSYYLFRSLQRNELSAVAAGVPLIILMFFDFPLTDVAILVPVLILSEPTYSYRKALPIYGLMAVLSLCKFSYLPVSVCIVLFTSVSLLLQRNWLSSLLNGFTFIACVITLWLVSGQSLETFILFLTRGYQVAGGYSEAMATPFWNSDQSLLGNLTINLALLAWGLLFIMGVLVLFFRACLDGKDWFKLFLTSPILFLAFKEGYVRMDFAHSKLFFSQLVLVLIVYILLLRSNKRFFSDMSGLLGVLILLSLLFVDASRPLPYSESISLISNRSAKETALSASQKRTILQYQLPSTLIQSVHGSPVDIFPYDVSLLYAYGFNWSPRPIFQSYSAYTRELDSLNAMHVCGSEAPDKLLFSFSSIDNRYPLFDEPMVLRAVRTNYQMIASYKNRFLLLERLRKPRLEHVVAIHNTIERLNAVVRIPTLLKSDTYMYADLQLTLLGKLCNFLLKVQPLYLEINIDGASQIKRYRLIRQTANDGLLVSSVAENSQSALPLLTGQPVNNGRAIRIIGNPLLYKVDVPIKFRMIQICTSKD